MAVAMTSCASSVSIGDGKPVAEEQLVRYENSFSGLDSIMGKDALKYYSERYAKAENNKAFAQSVSGAWAARSARTSVEHAITNALVACQTNNKAHESAYPCKIINVNGTWVSE
ncbi:MAG: hypothetical protein AAFY29_22255 [Pseudomonadota bacterium]